MAFGGSGGGFNFGNSNNNNQQQSSVFGSSLFGNNNNNNTTSTFGSNTNNTGFGSTATNTNPFGTATNSFGNSNNTSSTFGQNTTGNSPFGGNKAATTPFGSNTTSTGGLFGSNTNTSSFGSGGFGSSTNTGFGSNNNGGNTTFPFGSTANKPTFGAAASSTPLFGQGGTGTTGGFGSTTTGFGASGTALNQPVPPSDGTGSTPFAPTADKEANGTQQSYQSITFQQPYQKYSFEELRLADYNAGRRFGNGSGQAGAFGSTSFGGFGNSSTGGGFGSNTNNNPFGSTTTASGGFGSTTATTGFGNTTGGSLFGNKPAGGIFGTQTTAAGTSGGLFGTSNTTTNTFGGNAGFGSNNNTGSGPFGNNQNKPTGGLFGTNTQTGTASPFGNNNQANTTGGLFGTANNTTNTGGGLFNNNNQQTNTGGSLFGNTINQPKPGGIFGGGSGGFGSSTTQNQTSSGLFGTANNNAAGSGGLFSNTTGVSLFGTNSNTNAGGGLFNNANQQNNTGGSLFGNTANQNKPTSLFGATTTGTGLFGTNTNPTNTTGGLFGTNANNNSNNTGGLFNTAANKPTTSLFGNSTAQSNGSLFGTSNNSGGLFHNSQNTQLQNQQQQQEGVKYASLLDPNPYGQSSIWTGLPAASPENSKPVFTPLTASQKLKESMMKPAPSLRLNQSRYMTPPRRNGYGFSYSTYGTPNSTASTPGGAGLSGSMYGNRGWSGGSFGRSFNKSASVQNLRAQFSSDNDELWKPGAFASSARHSSGSIKRLTIDRSIRNDLFSRPTQQALPPPVTERTTNGNVSSASTTETDFDAQPEPANKFKKRVSFDNSTTGGQLNAESGALVRTESPDGDDEFVGRQVNGEASSRGNELAVVPEDRESNPVTSRTSDVQSKADPKPGDYWMKPSRAEMARLPREQLQRFRDFQVGRHGCGQVTFNGTVDLTALPFDDLYDKIVEIRLRSVTVYPEASSKPPVGKGLNVPSTIAIENSWPRSRNQPSSATSGPVFDKHVNRLKKMAGTEFVDYEAGTGIWTFRVPHYTRYGLDYDNDEQDTTMSEFSAPPDSVPKSVATESVMEVDADDSYGTDDNDTFAFKQAKTVPGGFGRQSIVDFDFEPASSALVPQNHDTEEDNLSESSAPYSEEEYSDEEPSMIGAYPAPNLDFNSPSKPNLKPPGTPGRPLLDLDGDWADQLQQTISPRKQNRDLLRGAQNKVQLDRAFSPMKPKQAQQAFRTSVDLMSSIFGKYEESRMSTASHTSSTTQSKGANGFEFPHAKRPKALDGIVDHLEPVQRKWLSSLKSRFDGLNENNLARSEIRHHDMAFDLQSLLEFSVIGFANHSPNVEHQRLPFSYIADKLGKATHSSAYQQDKDLYSLAHVLFDVYEDQYSLDLPTSEAIQAQLLPLVRKDRLTDFFTNYIHRENDEKIRSVEKENATAAALLKLSGHDIKGACESLAKVKNYKLMLLVSQLEKSSQAWQQDIRAQIDAWRDQNVLSEMTDDVRALYEVCAGNVTICQGKSALNVPVEDKATTFALSEEFGLSWLQCLAMGLWYGIDEKKGALDHNKVEIQDAVKEFSGRCERGEESAKPGQDVMWVLLRLYASLHGVKDIIMPVFPEELSILNSDHDASRAFCMHFAIASTVEEVVVDIAKADELSALFAWQLSRKDNIAGAVYALLHLSDITTRKELIKALLERFASALPEAPINPNAGNVSNQQITITKQNTAAENDLWNTLTAKLLIPPAWIFQAKAQHAHETDPSGQTQLEYLIAAQDWAQAHYCLVSHVAPSCIVDRDYTLLSSFIELFGKDVEAKLATSSNEIDDSTIVANNENKRQQDWYLGGGMYADFLAVMNSELPREMDSDLVNSLAVRLIDMGRKFELEEAQMRQQHADHMSDAGHDKMDDDDDDNNEKERHGRNHGFDLGQLNIEKLEERVAVREMASAVAEKMGDDLKSILSLPLTSDVRLKYSMRLAATYYRETMHDGAGSV